MILQNQQQGCAGMEAAKFVDQAVKTSEIAGAVQHI